MVADKWKSTTCRKQCEIEKRNLIFLWKGKPRFCTDRHQKSNIFTSSIYLFVVWYKDSRYDLLAWFTVALKSIFFHSQSFKIAVYSSKRCIFLQATCLCDYFFMIMIKKKIFFKDVSHAQQGIHSFDQTVKQ